MRKGVTRRWFMNTMCIIVIILMAIVVSASVLIRRYYYNSVQHIMESRVQNFNTLLSAEPNDSSYVDLIIKQIETSDDQEILEVLAIDHSQRVIMSSSGFPATDYEIPEFEKAIESGFEQVYIGKSVENEPYMAITSPVPRENDEVAALRFVTSLRNIDNQMLVIIAAIAFVGVVVILLVGWSGSYFIRSIVIPVGQVSSTARKIASGDFSQRLVVGSEDEIGELCETINYMAEELYQADKMKNDFISSVSHELRTPLTAIRGWAETLDMSGFDDANTRQKGMKVILSETERLSGMVEELLDFSRMQGGGFSLIKQKTDILAELEESLLMFDQRAHREGVEIVYDPVDFIAPVMGDKNRLKQVFVNILDNALKYTENGDKINIRIYESEKDVVIKIADTGEGISKEDLTQVKTKFYKGTGARRGSGIGLAVVDEIIRRHNGTFDIDSVKGEGTTVTICIPKMSSSDDGIMI